MAFSIVYLTGAPATGKSTLGNFLKKEIKDLLYIEYGNELTNYINNKKSTSLLQENIRKNSSKVIDIKDVQELDDILINKVQQIREKCHIVFDSHAVTKEDYGFRAIPFSLEQLKMFSINKIFVLFASSKTIIERIKKNSMGRPLIDKFNSDIHTYLQSSVAISYSVSLGVPILFFDSSMPFRNLRNFILDELSK